MKKRISGVVDEETVSVKVCCEPEPSSGNRREWFRHAVSAMRSFRHPEQERLDRPDDVSDTAATSDKAGEGTGKKSKTESWLKQMTHRAMGGEFQLLFDVGRYRGDLEAGMNVFERLDQLESQLSYFRLTSEVSRINAMAFEVPMVVEPRLFALLTQSLELSRLTDGAMDITSAPLTELWKTARQQERIPTANEIRTAKDCCGYTHIELNPELRTIRFLRPGMRIDLGCIGKGFALDETASLLTEAGVYDFLYHGGYSSILASGSKWSGEFSWNSRASSASDSPAPLLESSDSPESRSVPSDSLVPSSEEASNVQEDGVPFEMEGVCVAKNAPADVLVSGRDKAATSEEFLAKSESGREMAISPSLVDGNESGWWVGLRNPLHPERRIARIRLRNRAIGTSGSQIQFFRYRGRRYGHLLDPRTGWPPQTNRAVTVVAPTATLADGLSTAFYVLTPEEIADFCDIHAARFPGLAVLLVDAEADGGCEIYSHGFADDDLETF